MSKTLSVERLRSLVGQLHRKGRDQKMNGSGREREVDGEYSVSSKYT